MCLSFVLFLAFLIVLFSIYFIWFYFSFFQSLLVLANNNKAGLEFSKFRFLRFGKEENKENGKGWTHTGERTDHGEGCERPCQALSAHDGRGVGRWEHSSQTKQTPLKNRPERCRKTQPSRKNMVKIRDKCTETRKELDNTEHHERVHCRPYDLLFQLGPSPAWFTKHTVY